MARSYKHEILEACFLTGSAKSIQAKPAKRRRLILLREKSLENFAKSYSFSVNEAVKELGPL